MALKAYKKALSLRPILAVYNNMAIALKKSNLEAARGLPERSLNPYYAEAHRHLSLLKKYTVSDPHFIQVKEIYQKQDLDEDLGQFKFALAVRTKTLENWIVL